MSETREQRRQRLQRIWEEHDLDTVLAQPIKIIETRVYFNPRQHEFVTHSPPKSMPKEAKNIPAPRFNKDGSPAKKRGPKPKLRVSP